jgi:Cu+-exporting ATPase
LEAYSKSRTSDAITALGKLRPSTAFLVTSGGWDEKFEPPTPADEDVEKRDSVNLPPGQRVVKVDAELLEAGDLVRIFKGSTPPADGFVVAGPYSRRPTDGALTTFDESSLTGESKPVPKHDGDDVFLGTINTGDAIEMRVKAVGGDSM